MKSITSQAGTHIRTFFCQKPTPDHDEAERIQQIWSSGFRGDRLHTYRQTNILSLFSKDWILHLRYFPERYTAQDTMFKVPFINFNIKI